MTRTALTLLGLLLAAACTTTSSTDSSEAENLSLTVAGFVQAEGIT